MYDCGNVSNIGDLFTNGDRTHVEARGAKLNAPTAVAAITEAPPVPRAGVAESLTLFSMSMTSVAR